jgi:hypothetical protein
MPTLSWNNQPGRFETRRESSVARQSATPHRSWRNEAVDAAGYVLAIPYRIVSFIGTTLFYACADLMVSLGPFLMLMLLFPAMLIIGVMTNLVWLAIGVTTILFLWSIAHDSEEDRPKGVRRTTGAH